MLSNQSPERIGMLAGGIAMVIALLTMQLVSRIVAPWLLVTEFFTGLTMQRLFGLTGELARFLLTGNPYLRITILLGIIFLIAGAALGNWANRSPDQLNQRVMQAAAILIFVTLTLIYLADSVSLEHFLQEILLTLALSFLVFAVVLRRLLEPRTSENRWKIAGTVAVIGLIVVLRDAWVM